MGTKKWSIRWAGAVATICLSLAGILPAAQAAGAVQIQTGKNLESISVDDGTGLLNEERLMDALEEMDFREPTKVAVYARTGEYSDDINSKTLEYAKANHPEWISDKPEDYGDYWADGMFIITLSVEGRGDGQIGTYFGEDRKVSESDMESIHEAGYDDFNLSRWTDGVIAVADQASVIMNRPWYMHPALWIISMIGAVIALISTAVTLNTRSTRRRDFDQSLETGKTHLTNVTMDLEETEISARTLPADSKHAAGLEHRFTNFMNDYRECFTKQEELAAMSKKQRSTSQGVKTAKTFAEKAQSLDLTDDAIIAAAALYTRSPSWQDAWRTQTKPLSEDLADIPNLIQSVNPELQASASALESFAETATTELNSLGTKLASEELTVDEALDHLSELRAGLTEKLESFSQAQIEAYAKTEEEKEDMRRAMHRSRYDSSDMNRGSGTILDVLNPVSMYWRVSGYNYGYTAGVNSVSESRQAASSSSGGISSGYSGGGSFSGSGGSSRF